MFNVLVGSLLNKADRIEAAKLVSRGEVIGIFNRGVCALWFDASKKATLNKIAKIKGEGRKNKAVALTMSLEEFIPMIDMAKLSDPVKKFLLSADLKHKIGSLVFIRAPLKAEYISSIPESAKTFDSRGFCMIQNWDSFGHTAVEQFLTTVKQLGVTHPGVTSMNRSGQPEIVDQIAAQKFCQEQKVPLFLKDPTVHPQYQGSFTIISLEQDGVTLSRDGNIPGWVIEQILGFPLISSNTKQPNYPQLDFPKKLLLGLPPHQIRQQVLGYINNP